MPAQKPGRSEQSVGTPWDVVRAIERWCADIRIRGSKKFIGRFATAEDAARAYDEEARKNQGAFARVNFPDEGERPA